MKRLLLAMLLLSPISYAGEVSINEVTVECPSSCTFSVTLEHTDEGWDHYANQWDVLTLDGKLLKSRVLYHPHEREQPFTRSLSGVKIPADVREVIVDAKDSVAGWGGKSVLVKLPR